MATARDKAGILLAEWEDKRYLKNLMGKYANLIILNRDDEIYGLLWSKDRRDTAYGVVDGWYTGDASVRGYYAARYEKNKKIAELFHKKLAGKYGERSVEDVYGVGVFRSMPMSCPLIEVAEDGKTARGIWVCQGCAADLYPYGPAARWIWGYYAADFVREGGAWKIWHLVWIEDLSSRCGQSWGTPETIPADLPEFAEIRDFPQPEPDEKKQLFTPWSPTRPLAEIPLPEPYASYTDAEPTLAGIPLPMPPADAGEPRPADAESAADASDADLAELGKILDEEAIRELVHRRVFYTFAGKRREELADLWVQREDLKAKASFGKNWGWYVGMDAITAYYADLFEARLSEQEKANGGARQAGNFFAHAVTTPVIELADDGGSARGLWYSIAQDTWGRADGTADARWVMEKIAIDLIKEGDAWRILNVMTAVDLSSGAGENYEEQPVYSAPEDDPVRMEFGTPTVQELAHDNMFNHWDDYPAMPEPYATFSDDVSYGPEGWKPPFQKGLEAGEGRNRL